MRAVWDEQNAKWWFSVLDIIALLTDQDDYTKTRNYWKYLKAKLKKENNQVVSATTQLKFLAPDGKKRFADMLDYNGIIALGKEFPGKKANRFMEWFTYSDESIDGKSKIKAYALFESSGNLTENSIAIGNYSFRQTVPSTGSGTEADSSLRQATNSSLRQAQRAVRIASLRQAQRPV